MGAGNEAVPRQAMLLAAGLGERMRPLSSGRAKPSLPLMNRPLLLHALDHLARAGVRKVVVNLHHAPETVEAILSSARLPAALSVAISREPQILGTSGGIRAALQHFDAGEPILVMNADSLSDADLGALAAAHEAAREARRAPATLAVRGRRPGESYSPVHLDSQGLVCGIGDAGEVGDVREEGDVRRVREAGEVEDVREAGHVREAGEVRRVGETREEGEALDVRSPVTFIGLHVVAPEAVARIPASGPSDIVRDVYQPHLREGGRLGAHHHRGWWVEIGTPALYLKAHLDLIGERGFLASLPRTAGGLVEDLDRVFAGPGCEGLERARVRSTVLGPACRLGDGCAIQGSILGTCARVGRGAKVVSSIGWDGAEVPDGATIRSSLVLAGAKPGSPAEVLALR